ncbi:MAG: dTMP kinase [Candidatus Phytoplasma asteris]|uniref:Thymidylate kinase n=2 Tax=16SrI (Aster yellows group) TaxID=3042590 RepID=KTHY_ONYPE|nr:dTMP kinase ['Chrysanthemum coronarium' phytoplasma]Q7WSH2.1 RecName: Full=Thymidylate kinase; AltName: Full=dTMP kinase [Onion yellows phytoplasma OY-M]TKA87561.1 MAG: thymidylate kinase [Periwinkle leaf yellowing phytoplasma]WEX19920.1 MAG: dTMP kinase [Candidatus Phytoplasma asteris]BAC81721.1 thymidylate kinase [Onion yellows phytoplasma]BAD04315.1 thymidylate kinase [Onion yellows phytoplasma OY-M]GAK73921.1 thymidylate kinase ['Chrysanthemum coronarium' phytoplasma]
MFISFEGCEGTGKTTHSRYLFEKLSKKYSCVLTKEPGGGLFNEVIRNILLHSSNKQIDFHTEALLFAADRAEHLSKLIIPALQQNKIVICDRYLDSTIAYQVYARGLSQDFVLNINNFALNYIPNITFYLDLDPKIGIQRVKQFRPKEINSFDLQKLSFHKKVRKGYLDLCQKDQQKRIFLIDASKPLENIYNIIEQKLKEVFQIEL